MTRSPFRVVSSEEEMLIVPIPTSWLMIEKLMRTSLIR
jgi:hypothetical protein